MSLAVAAPFPLQPIIFVERTRFELSLSGGSIDDLFSSRRRNIDDGKIFQASTDHISIELSFKRYLNRAFDQSTGERITLYIGRLACTLSFSLFLSRATCNLAKRIPKLSARGWFNDNGARATYIYHRNFESRLNDREQLSRFSVTRSSKNHNRKARLITAWRVQERNYSEISSG